MSNFHSATRGKGGHLFRLTCSVVLWWGGTLQTNIPGVCGECLQCLHHTGFASAHGVCAFLVYTAQAPGCSVAELSKAGPGLHALSRSKLLRFRFSCTPQRQTQLGLRFLPFPGLSSSGNQVLGEHTLPGRRGILSPPLSQPLSVSWVYSKSAISAVPYVSSGELISDSNCPGGCQSPRIPGRFG